MADRWPYRVNPFMLVPVVTAFAGPAWRAGGPTAVHAGVAAAFLFIVLIDPMAIMRLMRA
jgi:hypothetical protein